jgi:choline transport protein
MYSLHVLFWSTWPQSTPVALNNFNWAPALFVGSLLLGMFYYISKARQMYASEIAREDDETTAHLISHVED